MQFHVNGFEPGDPDKADPVERLGAPGAEGPVPDEVDVLIVGCGPAGLNLAAQLAAFPDIKVAIVEQKPSRLLRGQADGIACRTMEMFNAYGFVERVLREAYWVNETVFWKPKDDNRAHIVRSGRVQDTEDGLSEFPHVILNQARVHDFFLDIMRNSPSRIEPYYSRRLVDLAVDAAAPEGSHGVTVTLERLDALHEGHTETLKARYVVGCDGARSAVRTSIGRALHGDSANQAWGVMDILVVTDFPDIRLKTVINSATGKSVLIIPREGGYMVRIYVELDKLDENERVGNRNITVDSLIATANNVFQPYTLDVKDVAWWSVYEIGQRLCDYFDDVPEGALAVRDPRVFIAGDACHTHSPKAGQGMNVSMQDTFNLGWKLAAVLQKRSPASLLHTYSAERRAIAKNLIDFDREWAALLSKASRGAADGHGGVDPAEIQRYFVQHGRYTAGTVTQYSPALLTGTADHQALAKGFAIGSRFHSAPVIRLADAKPVHLGHAVQADGRFRLFAFAGVGDPFAPGSALNKLCTFLAEDKASPVVRYTKADEDIDAVIDVRAILQQGHRDIAIGTLPDLLLPAKGRFGLRDYEKVFCPDLRGDDIFDLRGIDRERGALVIVRPDQHVAHVLPLDDHASLAAYFDGFMLTQS